MSLQVHCFRSLDSPSNGGTEYISPINGQYFSSTEFNGTCICTAAGTFSNFKITLQSAPGGGKSYTFTLRINGVDTAAVITISGTSTSGTYTATTIALADGDELTIKSVASSTPTASAANISWDFNGTTTADCIHGGGDENGIVAVARYGGLLFRGDVSNYGDTVIDVKEVIACPGAITKYTLKTSVVIPAASTLVGVIYLNGTAQDGTGGTPNTTLTMNAGDQKISATFTLNVVAGDYVNLKLTPTGSTSDKVISGVKFSSTTAGQSNYSSQTWGTISNSAVNYANVGNGSNTNGSATETDYTVLVGITGFQLSKLYTRINTAILSGGQYTYALRKNLSSTPLSCVIATSGFNEAAHDSVNSLTTLPGDTLDMSVTPSGTPSSRFHTWSMVQSPVTPTASLNKTQPVLLNNQVALTTSGGTNYQPLAMNFDWATEIQIPQIMAHYGAITNVRLNLTVAPGVGKSFTFTLRKNFVDTAITFTISGTSTSGSDTTHTVVFAEGDFLDWAYTSSGTPAATKIDSFYFELLTSDKTCQFGGSSGTSGAGINAWPNGWGFPTTGVVTGAVMPCSGTFTGTYMWQLNGFFSAGTYTAAIAKNGVLQDGSGGTVDTRVVMPAFDASVPSFVGGAFSLSVAAGDNVSINMAASQAMGLSKIVGFCCNFIPDGTGVPISMSPSQNLGASAGTEYLPVVGSEQTPVVANASELKTQTVGNKNWFLGNLYIILSAAAGVAKSRAFTFRKNTTDQALTVTISGNTDTTGNDTSNGHKFRVSAGDDIGFKDVITGTATAAQITYAFTLDQIGGGKGAGSIGPGGKVGGGALSVQYPGGASCLTVGNPGLDISISS